MRIFWQRLIKVVGINTKSYVLNQIKCFLCLIIYTLSSITFPSFLSKIVDLGIMTNSTKNIVLYVSEMLACGIVMVLFYYLQKILFFKFGNEIVLGTKQKLYKKLNIVDIGFWDKYKVGDILTILDNDIERLQELLTSNISEFVVNFFCV